MRKLINSDRLAQWRRRMSQFQSSGLSVADFCRRESVTEGSFYYWSRRLRTPADKSQSRAPIPRQASRQVAAIGPMASETTLGASVARVDIWLRDTLRVSVPATCESAIGFILERLHEVPISVGQSSFERVDIHAM